MFNVFAMKFIALIFFGSFDGSRAFSAEPIRIVTRSPSIMHLSIDTVQQGERAPLAVISGVSKQFRVNALQRMLLPPGSRPNTAIDDISLAIRPGTMYIHLVILLLET